MSTHFDVPTTDSIVLKATVFPASTPARAVCVIAHGMGEHRVRYERVAAILSSKGITVVTYDQRGHGETGLKKHGEIKGGWQAMVDDIEVVRQAAKAQFGGKEGELPIFIFGHSMGSMATQSYLLDHSHEIAGAILSGSTAVDVMASNRNPDQPPDLSAFNAPFAGPTATGFEWLSRDQAEVQKYVDDPWCGFGIDLEASNGLMSSGTRLANPSELSKIRSDLPIYIFSGDRDPVAGPGAALIELIGKRYKDAGIEKTTVKLYVEGRHEMLNETNRDEVHEDLLAWFDSVLGN